MNKPLENGIFNALFAIQNSFFFNSFDFTATAERVYAMNKTKQKLFIHYRFYTSSGTLIRSPGV